MKRQWTTQSALSYVAAVQCGRNHMGLSYWSAVDYLRKAHVPVPATLAQFHEDNEEGEENNG